ncbi:asparagine synthase (glutamine-hydrolyzing) [Paenibacillus polysaccharolyticus]|uniref:asparagine synthase (glutamine-hydrolyzing) n=1 Tax=Paenibacillus polysaccharolyticus TaxID=582692 RepID=UPI00204251CF|nr:asparagine synthase (glutamine-hydrolyzing) [Paenibacillus polysaccharolyticus]MCM3132894.1 asparagine synthase (glutamine-hydrolyzing) [Paenibacillus polysaccharolyticus]
MCRIFGYLGDERIGVERMATSSSMQYNGGPDEQSVVIKDGWGLGINRLSIQDIATGGQPYALDNLIYAVFNGEIYNHLELKEKLFSKGYTINNNSDGGLIPSLYAEYGEKCFDMLDGMFAIAVIDLRNSPRLVLACDHLGIKSLYYKIENSQVLFSSELQGLWSLSNEQPEIRFEKFDMYCAMQSILGKETIYKNVYSLEPGIVKSWSLNGYSTECHFFGPHSTLQPAKDFEESAEMLRTMLTDEVASMLTADVPVCLVTSGGLDSSLISVLAAEQRSNLKAFNIAYKGTWPDDERKYAIELAEQHHIDLEVIEADPDTFIDILPKMLWHLGQPNAAPHSLSTYLLFETIHQRGFKVAVTGEGADEQFGGYARFAEAISNQNPFWWESYLDKMSAIPWTLREEFYHGDYHHFLMKQPSGYERVRNKVSSFSSDNRLGQLLNYDLFERFPYYILRRVDHLSMAHAVEVRVPFCQPQITHFASQLPDSWKIVNKQVKRILYQASEQILPRSILNRPKQPFTLPIQGMLLPAYRLFSYFAETLLSGHLVNSGIIRKAAVQKLIDGLMLQANATGTKALWTLAIYELWHQTCLSKPSIGLAKHQYS